MRIVPVIIALTFLILFLVLTKRIYHEYYNKDCDEYDYDTENPNALIQGTNIAGTVYAAYPDSTPGLGWIL